MKNAFLVVGGLVVIAASVRALGVQKSVQPEYFGSTFNEVWSEVGADAYRQLPQYKVSYESLTRGAFEHAANGTLDDRNDFRPTRQKLVHPNGVCMAGVWEIGPTSPYSGYFDRGRRGLVVARASASMDATRRGVHRAFGLAIKLFPTLDPNAPVYTSNLFTVDNIQGRMVNQFTETALLNDIPDFNWVSLYRLISKLQFLVTFQDKSRVADFGNDPLIRRTVEFARAGITREHSSLSDESSLPRYADAPSDLIREPKWIKLQALANQNSTQADFRNEVIDLVRRNGHLTYGISVANEKDKDGEQIWQRIGSVRFTRAIASVTCDKRLHFHHPRADD